MSQPKKKLNLRLRPSTEHSNDNAPTPPRRRRLNIRSGKKLKTELDELDTAFEIFNQKINQIGNISPERKNEVVNHLLSYFQQINLMIQKINRHVSGNNTMGNLSNQMTHQENNRTYEINNEITLLNFGETHLRNIIDMFSDPDFITHIIRKDDFKNKYSVIVYDKRWDAKTGDDRPIADKV